MCKFLPSMSSNTFRSMGNKILELENSMGFRVQGATWVHWQHTRPLKNINLPCYQYLNFHMQLCTNGWQHYIQWHLAEESSKSSAIQGFLFQIHTFTLSHENHERLRGSHTSRCPISIFDSTTTPPKKKQRKNCLWFCWNKVKQASLWDFIRVGHSNL